MNIRSLTRGDGAVIGAAALLLIASFLPIFTYHYGPVDASVNAWDPATFPTLPSVHLAALAAAGLFVAARVQPEGTKVLGLELAQWGRALAVFAGWSALWSAFASLTPNGSDGSNVSLGTGGWLTLVLGLLLAAAAVMADRLPALNAPLVPAPRPAQSQPYQPAGAQPYGMQPGAGGYGYPGTPAYGAQPQPGVPMGAADQSAGAVQQQAQAPAAEFAPFWFAVPTPRPLFPEDGSPSPVAELLPGTWYLAVDQHGSALVAQTQDGRRGLLQDTSGIQRG